MINFMKLTFNNTITKKFARQYINNVKKIYKREELTFLCESYNSVHID